MKRLISCLYIIIPCVADAIVSGDAGVAYTPLYTTCPSGYVAINEPDITIATTCPSSTVALNDVQTCLRENPESVCYMFAPKGVTYVDSVGEYRFNDICTME